MSVDKQKTARKESPYMNVPSFFGTEGEIDLLELVGMNRPIEIEVGFGRGHFLTDRAAFNPNICLIGLETKRKMVQRAIDISKKREIKNTIIRHGDGVDVLCRMRPDSVVSNVFINFPDPWWKARHEKRIVIKPEMISNIARLLIPNGKLFIQTDVEFRAQAYQKLLSDETLLEPVCDEGWIDENRFGVRSSRERRCGEISMPIYRLLFKRKSKDVR